MYRRSMNLIHSFFFAYVTNVVCVVETERPLMLNVHHQHQPP